MGHTIRDIAAALGAEAAGDLDLIITRAQEPALAGPDALALAMDPKYAEGLAQGAGARRIAVAGGRLAGDGAESRDLRAARRGLRCLD